MRKSLLETFNKIYILDLHGNSKKKEVSPDGTKDENVFDIMQGVSINVFIKNKVSKGKLGDVYHSELWGKREKKYKDLQSRINNMKWTKLKEEPPNLFFVPKDFTNEDEYRLGIKIDELMKGISGIETKRDHFAIDFELNILKSRITDFVTGIYSPEERKKKFLLRDNEWVVEDAVKSLTTETSWQNSYVPCVTRPFDKRWTIYDKRILSRDRGELMAGMNKDNFGIVLGRQSKEAFSSLIINSVCTHKIVTVYDRSFIFPLYLYSDYQFDSSTRQPSLDQKIIEEIAKTLNLKFIPDHEHADSGKEGTFNPLDVLDYIYAILHSPKYRERYKEFLKIDFPRIPFTSNKQLFWKLVEKGSEIRKYHLMEHKKSNSLITKFPVSGLNEVTNIKYQENKVWINDTQFFDKVPHSAWEFYVGGYQPAQKWLKDRKGRKLSFDEVIHYQKIIVALVNTDRLMKEVDSLIKEWPMK
jgi:predicted helicase